MCPSLSRMACMNTKLNDYIDTLRWRYATKEFNPSAKISDEDFEGLLEALRLSASSFGMQLWKFVVVKDPALRTQLREASRGQTQITDASHLVVICRPSKFDMAMVSQHVENTAKQRGMEVSALAGFQGYLQGFFNNPPFPLEPWIERQLYIALGTLLSAAAVARIDACPMEGFSRSEFDRILGLEELGLNAVLAVPLGYRADTDKYARLAKVRYPREQVVLFK